jgi:hypothetical protein
MNCRNVSLQPTAATTKIAVPKSSHKLFKRDFIKTPPVLPV